ncbi:MAG TPA: clostripain-related cysteine peptidase [Thiobacillaceae bacterium]|nr:clostripain-related cysteine peptidase [Thiobacillaceae bacterium]
MRDFTVLVFMAADNDLGRDSFAARDIHEMEKYGSDDRVAIAIQVDRYGGGTNGTALRGQIIQNPNWQKRPIENVSTLVDIGETDTGHPDVLKDFIVWGATEFPAKHTILVIWAHGTGWRAEVINDAVGKSAGAEAELAARSVQFGEMYRKNTAGLVFRRSVESLVDGFIRNRLLPNYGNRLTSGVSVWPRFVSPPAAAELSTVMDTLKLNQRQLKDIFARAVAADSTDLSALDSIELKRALVDARNALRAGPAPDFDYSLIGFDACLMGSLEALYQLKDIVSVIVASEEEEPRTGWRYDLVLERLRTDPQDLETLGAGFVDDYVTAQDAYFLRLITQSAVRGESLEGVADMLHRVGEVLEPLLNTHTRLLQAAEKTATRFRGDKDFLDIGHFLTKLEDGLHGHPALGEITAARAKLDEAVISSRFAFPSEREEPTGLSIYFPAIARYDPVYDALDISSHLKGWVDFIKAYHFL